MDQFTFPLEFILYMSVFAYLGISGAVCYETSNEFRQGVRKILRSNAGIRRLGRKE